MKRVEILLPAGKGGLGLGLALGTLRYLGHFHDTSVTSVGIERAVELDLRLANAWISTLLQEKGADIFRMKGVLAMAGDGRKYVYQGVHMMFKGEFLDDELWAGDAPPPREVGRHADQHEQ